MRAPERSFFERDSVAVAPDLLGAVLSHTTPEGTVSLRLTEVEAYLGHGDDPGSHAFRGKTPRNAVMFGEPGHVYVYFTYGMHACANLVCSPQARASAVLLRAAEVVEGVDLARLRRSAGRGGTAHEHETRATQVSDRDLARGPARLTVAAGIRLDENGADAFSAPFSLVLPDEPVASVAAGPRTGVSGAGGDGGRYPWRFWIPGERSVSPYKRHPKAGSAN
nr:DNA-3-methyladenine glycosylase [Humibacter albus]